MLWHCGHDCTAMAGAALWVLRARFFRFEVRRFGTAMGKPERKGVVGRSPAGPKGVEDAAIR